MNSFPSFERPKQPNTGSHYPWEEPPRPKTETDEQKHAKPPEKEQRHRRQEEKTKSSKNDQKETAEESRPKTQEHDEEALKEKRQKAVERSVAYKKQFEKTEIPRDPSTLARLLVADQILTIHEQLEQPGTTRPTLSEPELLARLDYFGELADKIEDPSSESSPEIEAAYIHVLGLAEAALEQPDRVEAIIEAHQTAVELALLAEQPNSIDIPQGEQTPGAAEPPSPPSSLSAAASLLIRTLTQFTQPAVQATSLAAKAAPQAQTNGGDGSSNSRSLPHPIVSARPPQSASARSSSHTHSAHTSLTAPERLVPATKRRSFRPLAVVALGSAVALGAKKPHQAETPRSSPLSSVAFNKELLASFSHPSSPPTTSFERPVSLAKSASEYTHAPARAELAQTAHFHPESNQTAQKLEHLPLHSLLRMATAIPVGHGNYLRQAFEKGQLDKEGLIKVLKSHRKGKDFLSEYRQQAARYRYLRSSPEFLRGSRAPSDLPSLASYDEPLSPKQPVADRTEKIPGPNSPSQTIPQPFMNTMSSRLEHHTWPTSPHPQASFWLIIGVTLLILVGLVIVFILLTF